MTEEAETRLMQQVPEEGSVSSPAIQIFADDISVTVRHVNKKTLIEIIWKLREILHLILLELDLEESPPKRNNVIIEAIPEILQIKRKQYKRPENRKGRT